MSTLDPPCSRALTVLKGGATAIIGLTLLLLWATGRSQDCAYDLTGNVSGHCPECNKAIRASESF